MSDLPEGYKIRTQIFYNDDAVIFVYIYTSAEGEYLHCSASVAGGEGLDELEAI